MKTVLQFITAHPEITAHLNGETDPEEALFVAVARLQVYLMERLAELNREHRSRE